MTNVFNLEQILLGDQDAHNFRLYHYHLSLSIKRNEDRLRRGATKEEFDELSAQIKALKHSLPLLEKIWHKLHQKTPVHTSLSQTIFEEMPVSISRLLIELSLVAVFSDEGKDINIILDTFKNCDHEIMKAKTMVEILYHIGQKNNEMAKIVLLQYLANSKDEYLIDAMSLKGILHFFDNDQKEFLAVQQYFNASKDHLKKELIILMSNTKQNLLGA